MYFMIVVFSLSVIQVKVNKFCTDRPSLISIYYVFSQLFTH